MAVISKARADYAASIVDRYDAIERFAVKMGQIDNARLNVAPFDAKLREELTQASLALTIYTAMAAEGTELALYARAAGNHLAAAYERLRTFTPCELCNVAGTCNCDGEWSSARQADELRAILAGVK